MSRKGAGGFSGFSVWVSFPQTQRKKETENISAGNACCLWSKVGTDQDYEKNCRMQDGVRHRELVFRDSTSVTLSSLPSRTTEEPQLALLRYRTSGSNKQPWILFAFKHMKTKTRGIFLNVEWKCNISFLSSFWVRGPTNKPRFSSGTGQTDVPLQLFFSGI